MAKFIATAKFEGELGHVGEGDSPELALQDFIKTGEFSDFCKCNNIKDEADVEVGIFKAIQPGSPEWDDEVFDPDWAWAIGDRVDTKNIKFLM